MNRRRFLGATTAGLGLAAVPGWIQKAFAGEPSSKTLVFDAYRRARRTGRSLLVFVIPARRDDRWVRGSALGAFITYATDAQLAMLAHCAVVCATVAHVHQLVPKAPAGEPLALLIDTSAVPARVHAITAELADPYANEADADDITTANIARVAEAFRAALGPGDPQLGADVRTRLSDRDVPGARWANALGCGVSYEHPDKDDGAGGWECGMGRVSEKSKRFLELLASK